MRLLITRGGGFLGAWVTKRLIFAAYTANEYNNDLPPFGAEKSLIDVICETITTTKP